MKVLVKSMLGGAVLVALTACGGGGGGGGGSASTTIPTVLSYSSPTSTTLAATQTEAAALAAEAKGGLTSAQSASASGNLPMGIETAGLPTGITSDFTSYLCNSGTAISNDSGTMMTAGYANTLTYTNCAMKSTAFVVNGSYTVQYASYTNASNFAINVGYNNFSISSPTTGTYTYNATISCTDVNNSIACNYSDGARTWGTVTYTSGHASGSYVRNYNNGVIKVTYNNFGSFNGTATITGASGNTATITYVSATTYTVDITINGSTTHYVITV